MVMASVVVVAGALISLVGIGNRWALLALTAFLGFAEGPNVLDVLSGGVDRPLAREDRIIEAIEAALAGVALSLLWTKQSRDWFFRRSGRKTHHAAQ